MKQVNAADSLIAQSKFGELGSTGYAYFYDGLVHDSQVLYLLARHFPERLAKLPADTLPKLLQPIQDGSYHSLSAAYTILALDAYAQATGAGNNTHLGISEIAADGRTQALPLPATLLPRADFSPAAAKIRFSSGGDWNTYYLIQQSGFDRALPQKEIREGLEMTREYTDAKGQPVTRVPLGEEIQVHLKFRALDRNIADVAMVDLLPGGFELVDEARRPADRSGDPQSDAAQASTAGGDSNWQPAALDMREDRIVVYGYAAPRVQEFVYRLKATNSGTFLIPPPFGESMYERKVRARGVGGRIVVERK
jgi:uncharacterized protein YfaS (alpha-2-macroglobulin family)